jgi:Ca-activated chloride channel family protein
MTLEQSGYLWLLLLIPCFMGASYLSFKNGNDWLYRFARTKKSPVPHALATILLSLALAALIIALAEPKLQYSKVVFNRSGIDVVIGIDVSKSMLAEDETLPKEGKKLFTIPNRLNRARYCALNIVSALKGERTGIFMFASKGVSVVPLTIDYGYCQYIIKHVNDATITIPGSDLGQAIATGVSLFEGSSRKTVKNMILISDGEDISDETSTIHEEAQRAAARGIAIQTVGIGMEQGVMIPIRDAAGTTIEGYYQDEDGSYLSTRLNQDTLKDISATTGGSYFRGHDERSGYDVVDAILKRSRTIEYTRSTELVWFSLSPVLLCSALLFFVLAMFADKTWRHLD